MKCKIYINEVLYGYCEDPIKFTGDLREKRRNGEISHQTSISYHEENDEILIFTDSGRARRPLIIVENGVPCLKEKHLKKLAQGLLKWDDLINNGIVEFLDAEEEENSYIAMNPADLTNDHTHLEIDPATMFGICAGIIPFSQHNSSPRNTMESGMTKQALGVYASNYSMRGDVIAHLLHHPQTPIVKTRMTDSTNYDLRPSGQNLVVAVLSYEGYNMEDAIVFNKSSLERGLARSSFFRTYDTSEKRYAGGQVDKFEVPDKNIKGYRSEEAYRNLDEDGVVNPESYVESGDVLIGKTSPPRFLEEDFGNVADRRRETSITVRHGEKGIVDAVLLSETVEGSRRAKIRIRDTRQPEYGDKFASRHGQKGVVSLIVSPEDMPFTESGVVPDIIINPHVIPSRMSLGQMIEMIGAKSGCLEGKRVDGTPFDREIECEIKRDLMDNGFESGGCESMYDGKTGERFQTEIFVGIAYYQKLHHMTTDKIYARSRGPVQVLTRQPTEGRAREGGLRFGEMERDCLIAHGAALTLKERLLDESDKYVALVCENCGMLAVFDKNKNKKYCPICGIVETYPIEISFAFKLLLDELKSLCIFPKLILGDKIMLKNKSKKKSSIKSASLEENVDLSSESSKSIGGSPDDYCETKLDNCVICGKKLTKNQNSLCRSCSRKQCASRIIKKLTTVVKPGIQFKKVDLKQLNLDEVQINGYIWLLQEFNLIEVDGNILQLRDGDTLNEFITASKMEPIDFDKINSYKSLNKTCKICGKELPISKFYNTSNGYGDNCKECQKLLRTADYLYDVINHFGFDNKFKDMDLGEYIPDKNQLHDVIWSLQDNDLLIEKENGEYILVDKSICLKFLDKYSKKQTFNVDVASETKQNNVESSNSNKHKYKQMKIILNARNDGKSCEEAVKCANVSIIEVKKWYKHGKEGIGKDNVQFYHELNKIENRLSNLRYSNERKQMEFVLRLLKRGKTKSDVAKLSGINKSTINLWYNQGKNNKNQNTIYFYNELKKINIQNQKSDINQSDVSSDRGYDDERKLMDEVLKLLGQGKSRFEVSKILGIKVTKISSWINLGINKYSDNTIYFFNEIKQIEKRQTKSSRFSSFKVNDGSNLNGVSNSNHAQNISSPNMDDDERRLMDVVLSALRNGKSRNEAAIEAGIHITKISSWEMNGKLKHDENTIYFVNELNKINNG